MSQNPLAPPSLTRVETHLSHRGFRVRNPFAPRERPRSSFVHALLATTLFRCWHILVFFAAWSTVISVLNFKGHNLSMQSTILTAMGTVLGFVISYRTTSSFERYNEGRRLWSQVILASRTFARTVWFHIPETVTAAQMTARSMIERKSVINLLEAFAISLKHYLRGEDGTCYQDLYYLVKFLPTYALPSFSAIDVANGSSAEVPSPSSPQNSSSLPVPASSPIPRKTSFLIPTHEKTRNASREKLPSSSRREESSLLPAYNPPKYHLFDLFPFSLFVTYAMKRGREFKGKTAARLRAKLPVSHNIPLEISLYLSSYIAALQNRKQVDPQTISTLLSSLNQLVDALTGLERILTTPIPFSYSIHLWLVTLIYCFALPFQIWSTLGWVTIPATIIVSFAFFGFLVAGEEIENPFGYDKNDFNLDHFTGDIIKNELRVITSATPPDPLRWAFAAENDLLFSNSIDGERITPTEWMQRGHVAMQKALSEAP
ncbi:UPF0187 protein [Termitomyces sp. J132]|nr:UPF0187 protein [Termitomyces sp. J132]